MRYLFAGRYFLLLWSCVLLCACAGPVEAAIVLEDSIVRRSFLSLDAAGSGFLKSTSGGEPFGELILEAGGAAYFAKKRLGGVKYQPIILEVGLGMSTAVYGWIADSWQGNATRKNGVITTMDYALKPLAGLQFNDALITETTFPACDSSNNDDTGHLLVTLTPDLTREVPPGQVDTAGTPDDPAARWLPCNFRLEIDGLECSKVNRIESFAIRQSTVIDEIGDARTTVIQPGMIEFPDLQITLAESVVATWKQWHDDFVIKGNNDETKERNGRLIFLSTDLQRELARVEFFNLGIFRLKNTPVVSGEESIRRVTAELYCERMTFVCNPAVVTPNTMAAATPDLTAVTNPLATTVTNPLATALPNPLAVPNPLTTITPDGGGAVLPVAQMPGDNGEIGKVYALGKADPLDFSLLGADFTVTPVVIGDRLYAPKANEKLLILRFIVHNPQQTERFVRGDSLIFTGVDVFDLNHVGEDSWGVAGTSKKAQLTLMPAQKLELYAVMTVPAKGPVPKLIVQATDREDSPVLRYDLRGKVTPLERPIADTADATGCTALEEVSARLGTAWPCNNFSVTVEKFDTVTTTLLDRTPAEGESFLVATLLLKNLAPIDSYLRWDAIDPVLTTAADEQLTYHNMLLATANRSVAQNIRPGAEMRVRIFFTIPADTQPRKLAISEGESRSYLFPVRE
jgi:hypothetical protein